MQLHVGLVAGVNLVADDGDFGRLHDALDEQGAGDDEAHLDGDGQVEDDGQQEGDQQYGDVALRVAEQSAEGAPTAHVVTDDDQHGGQRGHGDVLGVGHQQQEDEQQDDGVDEARNGGAPAVVDVRHRAGYGSRGGYAAEDGGDHVGHALGDEFHVRVVAVRDGAVGHGGRE